MSSESVNLLIEFCKNQTKLNENFSKQIKGITAVLDITVKELESLSDRIGRLEEK